MKRKTPSLFSVTHHPVRTFPFAVMLNVVDGDTCDVGIDLGFTVHVQVRLRLAHINAPETGTPGGAAATAFLKKYLGQSVDLTVAKTDKYGRYLAEIRAADGTYINQAMLDQKLAVPYEGQ
jgi:endonuclease YncB( thermonuclease family)